MDSHLLRANAHERGSKGMISHFYQIKKKIVHSHSVHKIHKAEPQIYTDAHSTLPTISLPPGGKPREIRTVSEIPQFNFRPSRSPTRMRACNARSGKRRTKSKDSQKEDAAESENLTRQFPLLVQFQGVRSRETPGKIQVSRRPFPPVAFTYST